MIGATLVPPASAQRLFAMLALKNLSRSTAQPREWFRDLLWIAFPARSDAALRYVVAVLVIAGAEAAFAKIGGRG